MPSGKIKTLFIINPILEKKSGKKISDLISENLDPEQFEFTILYSEYPGHTEVLANQNAGQFQLMVAGGGDGTINQVARSLVHSETALGILPMGSGKGLARSLNIPMDMKKAIRVLNSYIITSIDTGMAGIHRFVNIAGIGFSAEIAHAYADTKKRGFFPYVINTAEKLPGYSSVSAKISIIDRDISGEYFDISFANSSQWGYGAHISPISKPDDGLLHICILNKFPKILIPGLLTGLYTKTIHLSRYMEVVPAKNAEITGHESFKGHIDGEPVEFTAPFKVSIEPGSLKVVCVG